MILDRKLQIDMPWKKYFQKEQFKMEQHLAFITCKCGKGYTSKVELIKRRMVQADPCPECGRKSQNTWDIEILPFQTCFPVLEEVL